MDSVAGSKPAGEYDLTAAQAEFDPDVLYLDTATMGLPPRRSWTALQASLTQWRAGRSRATAFDEAVAGARAAYARLVKVEPGWVAVGSQVSVFAGLIAANLPDGADVLVAEGDFTSILFPFLAQAGRVTVREAPLAELADAVRPSTTLVAVSAVQSADGALADLDALHAAAAANGAKILLDTTQAIGWLPVEAGRFAYTVCGGYKWLLSPRGTAYLTVRPELLHTLVPHTAGWYAGESPWASIYGGPLRLASDARRFDVSPAWHCWVGAAPSLDLLASLGSHALHRHSLGLANRFRGGIGLDPGDSAIVSIPVGAGAAERLAEAGIAASLRAGRLRLSFHLCVDEAAVDRAVEVLRPHLAAAH